MGQSPIRLKAMSKAGIVEALPLQHPLRVFEVKYDDRSYNGSFQGESGHANFELTAPGPQVEFRGIAYELKKIHIHNRSEHIVERDDAHDLELHLIHTPLGSPVESPLVVIGILFNTDSSKKKLPSHRSMQVLSKAVGSKSQSSIQPLSFFPHLDGAPDSRDTTNWFYYEGSLTSFPFTENVSWIIMKSPSFISKTDIKPFIEKATQHPRELQPLERRIVVRSFS